MRAGDDHATAGWKERSETLWMSPNVRNSARRISRTSTCWTRDCVEQAPPAAFVAGNQRPLQAHAGDVIPAVL